MCGDIYYIFSNGSMGKKHQMNLLKVSMNSIQPLILKQNIQSVYTIFK